jgi:hypothetical protein
VSDNVFADGALMVEVEVLEGFAGREAGGADAGLATVGLAGGDLAFQAGGQEVLMGPDLGPGADTETFNPGEQGGGFELPAQVGQVPGAAHAAPDCPVIWS